MRAQNLYKKTPPPRPLLFCLALSQPKSQASPQIWEIGQQQYNWTDPTLQFRHFLIQQAKEDRNNFYLFSICLVSSPFKQSGTMLVRPTSSATASPPSSRISSISRRFLSARWMKFWSECRYHPGLGPQHSIRV